MLYSKPKNEVRNLYPLKMSEKKNWAKGLLIARLNFIRRRNNYSQNKEGEWVGGGGCSRGKIYAPVNI